MFCFTAIFAIDLNSRNIYIPTAEKLRIQIFSLLSSENICNFIVQQWKYKYSYCSDQWQI